MEPSSSAERVVLLRAADRTRYLWGDDTSGQVIDWYYLASEHLLVSRYAMAPGAIYRHSEVHKSYYQADEVYRILQGELTFHEPSTGEVHTVRAGEAMHFRPGTWHYGYNFGPEQGVILVAFAPLPPDITDAQTISDLATPLPEIVGGRWDLLGDWPWNAEAARAGERIKVLRRPDWLEVIHGTRQPVRVELYAATERVTMGQVTLPPGVVTDPFVHPGDCVLVATDGWAGLTWDDRPEWIELQPLDGARVLAGVPYRLMNHGDRPATLVFGAAPAWR